MKILLPITLLILASTSSYGAFQNGNRSSDGGGYNNGNGYKAETRNGGYRVDDFYEDDLDNSATIPEIQPKTNKSKATSPAPATATTKVKEQKPVAEVPKSNPDAGKKIQKVTRGDVVTYEWASSNQLAQNEAGAEVEIITVDKSGFTGVSTNGLSDLKCKVDSIGVNADDLLYYGAEMPLKNLAKMSQGWIRPWGSELKNVALDLDENGELRSLDSGGALSIISEDKWGRKLDDTKYVLLYDGQGDIKFILNNKLKVIKKQPGRIEFEWPPQIGSAKLAILLEASNPSNYLRNIRIISLESEDDYNREILRKEYRNVWAGIGVVRYLNPQRTNNSKEVTWGDRVKQTTFGAKGGQSLEDIIQASNEMNTNPWLLVPHMADDDYFRKMAVYVRDNLNPHLKVYIEYTNEAWNWQFTQPHYLDKVGKEMGVSYVRAYAVRSKKLFEVWGDVFQDKTRLVRVIGTQFQNSWLTKNIMSMPGLADVADALAVGYYVGGLKNLDDMMSLSEDEVFNQMTSQVLPFTKEKLLEQKQLADEFGLDLVAYEAGQHLAAKKEWRENKVFVDKLISLNRHPRMGQIYADMYKNWNDVGGGLIVWFQTAGRPSKWGSWGILENGGQDPETSPKYQAIKKMLTDKGC